MPNCKNLFSYTDFGDPMSYLPFFARKTINVFLIVKIQWIKGNKIKGVVVAIPRQVLFLSRQVQLSVKIVTVWLRDGRQGGGFVMSRNKLYLEGTRARSHPFNHWEISEHNVPSTV